MQRFDVADVYRHLPGNHIENRKQLLRFERWIALRQLAAPRVHQAAGCVIELCGEARLVNEPEQFQWPSERCLGLAPAKGATHPWILFRKQMLATLLYGKQVA